MIYFKNTVDLEPLSPTSWFNVGALKFINYIVHVINKCTDV